MKKIYVLLLLYVLAGCTHQASQASLSSNQLLQSPELSTPTPAPATKEPKVGLGDINWRHQQAPASFEHPVYPVRPIYPQHHGDIKQEKQEGGLVRITTFTSDDDPQQIFAWYREQLTQAQWGEDTYQMPADRIGFYYIANGSEAPAFDMTIVIERIDNVSHVLIEHAISGFSPAPWPED
jgi:hypothetical protein